MTLTRSVMALATAAALGASAARAQSLGATAAKEKEKRAAQAKEGKPAPRVITQEELIGFVLLAAPRAPVEINWEVLDLLKTAARQVGSFLAQIQASEALLEARKFDAFNKMSAFVVHDLKNLVAQLSLLLANAIVPGRRR